MAQIKLYYNTRVDRIYQRAEVIQLTDFMLDYMTQDQIKDIDTSLRTQNQGGIPSSGSGEDLSPALTDKINRNDYFVFLAEHIK